MKGSRSRKARGLAHMGECMKQRFKREGEGRGVGRLLSVSMLALLLGGCSDLGLFTDTKTADDGSYPNLGTVPARPAPRTDAPERQSAREGLAADRANARYSADPIRRPFPDGKAAAVAPTFSDGSFPAQSNFRPTEAPPGSAPAPVPARIAVEPIAPPVSQVAPSSEGLPVIPPSEPRQPAPEPPPPLPADLVPQAAPAAPVASAPVQAPPTRQSPPASLPSGASVDARLDAMLADVGADPVRRQVLSAESAAITTPSLATLYFPDGSAQLDRAALDVLRQVAQIHKARGGRLVLVGHASRRAETNDARKRETFNQTISTQRAENVRKALVRLKVPALDLAVRAAGDQAALFDEAAPAGEAANRKVEIYLED